MLALAAAIAFSLFPAVAAPGGSSLDLMFGNDNITYGIVRNSDDGLTYGLKAAYEDGPLQIALSLGSVTVRGAAGEDGLVRGRYDELTLGVRWTFAWTAGRAHLRLAPFGGLALVGPLGLAEVQNLHHRVMGKAPVELPQERGTVGVYPTAGLGVWCGGPAGGLVAVALEDALAARIPLDLHNTIAVAVEAGGRLRCALGWRTAVDLEKGRGAHAAQIRRDNGVELALGVDGGLLALDYRANLGGRFAYGLVGIDPLAFRDMESFDDLGVAVAMGVEAGTPIQMHRLAFEWSGWVLKLAYKGGEVEVGTMERRAFADYALGRRVLWERGVLSPFVLPFLGAKQYIFYKPGISGRGDETLLREYRFMAGLEAGARVGGKGALRIGGCSYSLDTGVGLKLCLSADSVPAARFPGLERFVRTWELKWFADILIDL